MKNTIKAFIFIILSVSVFFGCKKEDHNTSNNSSSSVTTIITSGTWRVSYYNDHGSDHTANFSGYTFTFSNNGQMTATNSSGTTNGTWNSDDSHNEIHISVGSSSPLSDISKGWLVTESSSAVLKLKDDSSNDELLNFTRN